LIGGSEAFARRQAAVHAYEPGCIDQIANMRTNLRSVCHMAMATTATMATMAIALMRSFNAKTIGSSSIKRRCAIMRALPIQ
jgi:hypothetical protein